MLTAYYGHLFVGQAARVVLPRDPSGRALIWGSVAAFAGITVVFAIWVLAVSGAVAPPVLARSASTVLVPLAVRLGPVAQILGAPIVIILLGLASLRCADVLFNLVRERLPAPRPRSMLGRRGRLVLALSPVLVAFLVAEWLLLAGAGSFARLMSMAGVITVSLFAGILPVLLLVASRRKGVRVPAAVYPVLGHPAVVGGIYLLFLSIILLHGLVIWQAPVERALALALAVLVVALTAWMVRGGAFRPRAVVELRDDRCADGQGTFAVTAAGRPLVAQVHVDLPEGARTCAAAMGAVPRFAQLRSATFHLNLSATHARELKVWAHQVTAEGESEGLPAVVHVTDSAGTRRFDLRRCGGQVVVRLRHADCRVLITMARPLDGLQENRG